MPWGIHRHGAGNPPFFQKESGNGKTPTPNVEDMAGGDAYRNPSSGRRVVLRSRKNRKRKNVPPVPGKSCSTSARRSSERLGITWPGFVCMLIEGSLFRNTPAAKGCTVGHSARSRCKPIEKGSAGTRGCWRHVGRPASMAIIFRLYRQGRDLPAPRSGPYPAKTMLRLECGRCAELVRPLFERNERAGSRVQKPCRTGRHNRWRGFFGSSASAHAPRGGFWTYVGG